MKRIMSTLLVLAFCAMLCPARTCEAATMEAASEPTAAGADQLPPPIVTANSVETCLNSRYSQHSLSGTAGDQQLSNIAWAAGKVPFTGTHRDMYVLTPTATYSYDPNGHSLNRHSSEVRDDGAFAIRYESELDFDTGVSFMAALLASVSLWNSTESPVASCPKGIGYPKARLIFGVQSVRGLTTDLAVHCSVAEGEPGWLPDPCTAGDNSLEEVLANLKYVSSFAQTNLTLRQTSQILWAGYGCTSHTASNGRAGLTVPSAWANYYLTGSIYLVNEDGVHRYQNRNPSTNLATRDHRIEPLGSADVGRRRQPAEVEDPGQPADVRETLQSAVSGLPPAPCYVILCLDSSYVGQEYARLETGFVAGNMLIQTTAMDLGCHFRPVQTADEQSRTQLATGIPASHIPQAIVSVGPIGALTSISVVLQGENRPDTGWAIPLTVRFFAPGADVLNDTPTYEFQLTTTRSATANAAVGEVTGIEPGTYDITVRGESTLMNVKRNVVILAPQTTVDLGTLLAGDANHDNIIDLGDYALLSAGWLASEDLAEYNARTDFDRDGYIDTADLCLFAANWLRSSSAAAVLP